MPYDAPMTVYDQIQAAIDYVERGLGSALSCHEAARRANMSLRGFYNYFLALTGYRYGEYVRRRRLSAAADGLLRGRDRIIDLALAHGYDSHEAFTRAFKEEYGETPRSFRTGRHGFGRFGAVDIVKERIMGIIFKELPRMRAVCCLAQGPDAEGAAHDKLWAWARERGYGDLYGEGNEKPYRLFGRDEPGPEGGYRLWLAAAQGDPAPGGVGLEAGLEAAELEPGRFAVLGIEGDVAKDWRFIPEGWRALESAATAAGRRLKAGGRRFEEKLEPVVPGNLRLDLYVELE